MRSKQEVEALLSRLTEWKGKQKRVNYVVNQLWFEDKTMGLHILEDFDHAGVSEWIEALEWILK